MTPVRMVHQLHGATHAYDQGEVERLKGYGWEVEKPPVWQTPHVGPVQVAAPIPNAPANEPVIAPLKRKPGRPRKE